MVEFSKQWMGWRASGRSGMGYGGGALLLALLLWLSLATAAWAIPSPELVIGSLSSLSQLFAVGTAMLGGGAAAVGLRSGRRGQQQTSRTAYRLAWLMFAACLISVGGLIFQYIQFKSAQMARLQATLLRPAEKPRTGEQEFKTLSFAEQQTHPLAISTEAAARLLQKMNSGEDPSILFLDIRETAENETGTLPGAQHIRFPDLPLSNIDLTQRKVVLFCHNGNRSYETCAALAEQGIDCKFLAGGIEKWIVEGRAFTNDKVRGLADLRAVPAYRNDNTLLDTPEVKALIAEQQAVIIDVRYPGAFARGHLPGAINIPLRATPTALLRKKIAQLPKRPLIIACYDRRGCFAGQVLGLELTRAGHDFRGRYTLPWEFYIPKPPKPHIKAWMAEQQRGLWEKTVTFVAGWLTWLAGQWGFLTAIFGLALLSRLIVLPVSVKAERDQILLRQLEAEKQAIETRLADDPPRRARALQAFYRKHGLTPGRNLLALAFLPLLAVGLSAVEQAGRTWQGPLAGFWPGLDEAPFWIWPLAVALLAGIYMQLTLARTRRQRLYVWGLGAPLMAGLALMLSKAGNLYLLISLSLLMLQRWFVTGAAGQVFWQCWRGLWAPLVGLRQRQRLQSGMISLAFPQLLAHSGNKAYRLAQLRKQGIPVPDGMVLTDRFLSRFAQLSPRQRRRLLNRLWRKMGAVPLAVRSSASGEDGAGDSFAGVFESVLNVTQTDLESAIETVYNSFSATKVKSYGGEAGPGNILLQQMVAAEYSGVLFTKDPQASGLVLIELVQGTADDLVSGQVTPKAFRFGRFSHELFSAELPPIDLTPLLAIGARCEQIFKTPQDIEWTYKDGRFQIVQSRDITVTSVKAPLLDEEWERLFKMAREAACAPDEVIFRQDEMSEVLPQPTPISLSMMQALWAPGGSVDLACRELGLLYPIDEDEQAPNRLTTVFGRLYTHQLAAKASAVQISKRRAKRLEKAAEALATAFKEQFLPDFLNRMKLFEVARLSSLTAQENLRVTLRLIEDFITATHVEVEKINIAADYFMARARQGLQHMGHAPAKWLAVRADAGPAAIIAKAAELPVSERQSFLLAKLGHRAALDYELMAPRYWEDPEVLAGFCASDTDQAGQGEAPEQTDAAHQAELAELPPWLAKLVERALQFQVLKEEAKHQSLRHYAIIRKALMALDRHYNLSGLVFYLRQEELAGLADSTTLLQLREKANRRLERSEKFAKVPALAAALSLRDLERASAPASILADPDQFTEEGLSGQLVAGAGGVEGTAYRVEAMSAAADFEGFREGDIIVCRMVDPAWLPYVLRAGGVVSEVGGWLSHMAIVAREHQIPMIVGVKNATQLATGTRLFLHDDGRVEVISGQGRSQTAPMVAE